VYREAPVVARKTPTPEPAPAPMPTESAAPAATPATPTPPASTAPSAAPAIPADATPRSNAPAQPAASAAPKEVSHVDCNIAQPDYPAMSMRHNESGTAVVRFVVGVDGHVESVKIQQSSGYQRLDDAALGAVRSGTCHPWKQAGVPVRVAYAQPFVFGLRN